MDLIQEYSMKVHWDSPKKQGNTGKHWKKTGNNGKKRENVRMIK